MAHQYLLNETSARDRPCADRAIGVDSAGASGETPRMPIPCHAEQAIRCPPAAAFALLTDHRRFPRVFVGYGPIAAIAEVTLDSPLQVGSTRRVHNADGTVLTETITAHDPPHSHGYVLSGFSPPFSWLVRRGVSMWTVAATEAGVLVAWDYQFTLTSRWAWPLAAPLLRIFMVGAMRRCLRNMAALLDSEAAAPVAGGAP